MSDHSDNNDNNESKNAAAGIGEDRLLDAKPAGMALPAAPVQTNAPVPAPPAFTPAVIHTDDGLVIQPAAPQSSNLKGITHIKPEATIFEDRVISSSYKLPDRGSEALMPIHIPTEVAVSAMQAALAAAGISQDGLGKYFADRPDGVFTQLFSGIDIVRSVENARREIQRFPKVHRPVLEGLLNSYVNGVTAQRPHLEPQLQRKVPSPCNMR